MPIFERYEGELVTDKSLELSILPFIMPNRSEALVFYEQHIRFAPLKNYLANRSDNISFFHVIIAAMVRAMAMRPKMNRFIAGNLLYQRKWIDISFVVKKEFQDDAAASATKVRFEKNDNLFDVSRRISQAIMRGRSPKTTESENDISLALKLPRPLLRVAIKLLKLLDYFNLLPNRMIDSDELFSSIFVANLGSLGMNAPYHHLYNWGTVPIFSAIGKVIKMPVVNENDQVEVQEILPLRWTFDERITDGFYCMRSMEIFKSILENPILLEYQPEGTPLLPPVSSVACASK